MLLVVLAFLVGLIGAPVTSVSEPSKASGEFPSVSKGVDPFPARQAAVLEDPWWPQWLAFHDRDGNLVEDAIEAIAAQDLRTAFQPFYPLLLSFDRPLEPGDAPSVAKLLDAVILHEFRWIPTILAAVPAGAVSKAGKVPGVAAVEWDRPLKPLLDVSAPATQTRDATGSPYNGQTAQSLGYRGEGMVIAVLDTGVGQDHPAFTGKWIAGAETTLQGTFVGNNKPNVGPLACVDPPDDDGHGTHVAATALGNPTNNFKGTALQARLVEIKIAVAGASGVSGQLLGQPFTVGGGDELGFEWILDWNDAIDAGAPLCGATVNDRIDVATLSFGTDGPGGPNAGTAEAIINQLTQNGVVVTIAAGNEGGSEFTISAPGNAAGALSIANSDDKNTIGRGDDSLATSSSRGPNQGSATNLAGLRDRYRKPDVAAPGMNIIAANGLTEGNFPGNSPFVKEVSMSGTSMATPHVAGIAALLLQAGEQAKAETGGVNRMRPTGPGFDASNNYVKGQHPVRDALIHGAEQKTSGVAAAMLTKWQSPAAGGLVWNNGFGYGHVNTFAALCWAWANVLVPAGATPSPTIQAACSLGPAPLIVDAGGPYSGQPGEPIDIAGAAAGGTPPYTYLWTVTVKPDGATPVFGDPTLRVTTLTVDMEGEYALNLAVTDSAGTFATAPASASVTTEPVSAVTIGSPSDGAILEPGTVEVSGELIRAGPAPAGPGGTQTRTLHLVGDGRAVTGTDPFGETNWPMSSAGHGNQRTWFDTVGGWNVQFDENPSLPTFITTETATFDGSPVTLRVFIDDGEPLRKIGNNCAKQAQLFRADGTTLGPAAEQFAPAAGLGLGLGGFREMVFTLLPPAGTYVGFKLQFGSPFINCAGPTTYSWGADVVPARLTWTVPGTSGTPGQGNATLTVAGESAPRAATGVVVGDDATVPYTLSADLSDLTGPQTLTIDWTEADGTAVASASIDVTIRPPTPAGISITSPADGATVEPDFELAGTTTGTGASGGPSPTSWSLRTIGSLPASKRDALGLGWHEVLPTVDDALRAVPGYMGSLPMSGPTPTLHAYFGGTAPDALPATVLPDGWKLALHERAHLTPLVKRIELPPTSTSGSQAHDPIPPVAPWNQYIQPGAQIFTYFDGNFNSVGLCTANFLWKDQRGELYLGAAGHCFLPETVTNNDFSFDYGRVVVDVCRSTCVVGGVAGAQAQFEDIVLDVVRLGPLVYARQDGPGQDFGIVKIPSHLIDSVNPAMAGWGGPTGVLGHDNFNGDVVLMHGNGIVVGETFATKNRVGVSLADGDLTSWTAIMTGMPGDSGSAIVILSPWDQAGNVASPLNAAGLLTHGLIDPIVGLPLPGLNFGTTASRAKVMANEAGLCLVPVLASQDPATSPPAPETPACPISTGTVPGIVVGLAATPGDGEVDLTWSVPDDGGSTILSYTVEYEPADGSGEPSTKVTDVPGTTIDGLTNDLTYAFRVWATNEHGDGPASIDVEATPTAAPPPFGVQVRILRDGEPVVDWARVDAFDPEAGSWSEAVTGLGPGAYRVEARLLEHGTPVASDAIDVAVRDPNQAPTAHVAGPTDATRNVAVTFDASASEDLDGTIVNYAWSFGDGATATGESASHTYTDLGTFTVTLVVTDDDGATGSATHEVDVRNAAPTAAISGPSSTGRGTEVTFDASASSDPDGDIVDYTWDFGDGATGTGAVAVHTYAQLGSFVVTVVVTDSDGATASATHTIEVKNAAPTASIQAPAEAKKKHRVLFDGTGSEDPDGSIASWAWDFGDGGTGTGSTIQHRFDHDGYYTVRLTVTDQDGATATTTHQIRIYHGNGG